MALSIKKELSGSVLLTGGVGFLGSVCLEQMLALTEVKAVYLLVRRKKGMTAKQRVQKFLCGPLFTELHQQAASGGPNVFNKVRVLEGDIELPDLGLSAADKEEVLSQVDVVIHSAAVLTLDAHIQDALRANLCGTQKLLQLAGQMRRLRSFVYVSTFYVNNFKPYNTPVPEEVHYPTLQLAGDPKELSYKDLTDLLLHMPGEAADKEVSKIMRRLNLTSTYAFSKLLTEQMVDDPAVLPGVAKAIVRPSLIASMAGAPFPGYISGYAGAPGYCLAYGMGFFHNISGVAFASDAIVDIIPVDTTSALTIAAAAAAASHGPYAGGHARVYHAASAASYPQRAPGFFEMLRKFWVDNPPPFALPFARYPAFTGRHSPTLKSIRAGTLITHAKVWLAARLLQLTGHKRKGHTLINGFKAFCVQNDPRYARSIVSCVRNARKLQRSLVPEEQRTWLCVWEEAAGASWDTYGATALAGLRTAALKLPPSSIKSNVPHNFTPKQPLSDPSLMAQWMSASSSTSSSSSSTAAAASPLPLPIDITAGSRTHGSSKGSHSSSSSVADSLDASDSIDSSSSLSSGYVAVGSAGVGGVEEEGTDSDPDSRRGWPELLSASEGHVKRTKSCHAVLVAAAY